ncbi:ABC transporter CDR4 [Verticillium dahliae VDG2]|nr:ABC transporter CDR4 [Verticillium dahliae VDG2]
MASVSSLDKDLRKLRLDRYTPAAANEVKSWIESTLGERLSPGDLLESLKDGVALCKLVNLALPPPGIKFKQSAMPFVQMENISHFLRACKSPPLNLQEHDVFLTVDLYEQKDPAQVLQCISAFSRAAHGANPARFPSAVGGPKRSSVLSPQSTGPNSPALPARNRGLQGNLGISFGGRRQITTAGPSVPSLAEKQRLRREREAEEEQQRLQTEEENRRRQAEREAEEEQARLEEERRWEEQTQLQREASRRKAEEEKRKWEEEERQWKMTEEKRRREEEEAEARLAAEKNSSRSNSDARLRGQFLSQYNEEQGLKPQKTGNERIAELERELEKARERERQYEQERQGRTGQQPRVVEDPKSRARSRSRPAEGSPPMRQDSWSRGEREVLRTAWNQSQEPGPRPVPARPMAASPTPSAKSPRPLPDIGSTLNNQRGAVSPPAPTLSPRPLPDPAAFAAPAKAKSPKQEPAAIAPPLIVKKNHTGSSRPLPDPTAYTSSSSSPQPPPPQQNRTDKFLSSNPAPEQAAPTQTYSRELGATAEQDGEDRRRAQSQAKTKAGGWASKSLLEREMEMERQRQREWEEAQQETAKAVRSGDGVDGIGGGVGGRWDVGQWSGFTGGDSQNKGGQGIGAGRRQIVGPRPLPGGSR